MDEVTKSRIVRVQLDELHGPVDLVFDPLTRRLCLGPQLQILGTVVVSNAVLVVNGLGGEKGPTKDLFHDHPMLEKSPLAAVLVDSLGHVTLRVSNPPTTAYLLLQRCERTTVHELPIVASTIAPSTSRLVTALEETRTVLGNSNKERSKLFPAPDLILVSLAVRKVAVYLTDTSHKCAFWNFIFQSASGAQRAKFLPAT